MQLNGIGNGHGAEAHHVTGCMHDHAHSETTGGAMSASQPVSSQMLQAADRQADAQFSLSAWLDKTLNGGRRLWGRIWGSAQTGLPGEVSGEKGARVPAQVSDSAAEEAGSGQRADQGLHTPQIAAAATAVVQPQDMQSNPYFAVERADERQGNLWQRAKVKFMDAAGQLAGHLPGKFFGAQTKSSFEAGQRQPREDLRKRSKYRRDEVEIDCVLTDDSYLLDSYDRRGEYSKLSAKK